MRNPIVACVVFTALLATGWSSAQADAPRPGSDTQVSAATLAAEAVRAVQAGQFQRGHELLGRAATLDDSPTVARMAEWAAAFEKQRIAFQTERRQQFDKAMAEVKLLVDHGKKPYAIDYAGKAYILAEDKVAFRKHELVAGLLKESAQLADQAFADQQWLTSLRLYSGLASIDPDNATWKARLKAATRRVRLLALYAPDYLKKQQRAESKERAAVDQLVNPTTQPATLPADDDTAADFRTDWRDSVAGIKLDMLRDALSETRLHYFKEFEYRKLMRGGVEALKALASTAGLESEFAGLVDADKRKQFSTEIEAALQRVLADKLAADNVLTARLLMDVKLINRDTIDLPEQVIVNEFADGAFGELDPFSSMIWPSELAEFAKTTQGEFSGVGIQIQSADDGSLKVVSPLEDSPAFRAGIKAGDVITHINGKNAKGITTTMAVKNITGPPGTTVTLTIRSIDSKVRDYTLRREPIKVGSVKGWKHLPGGGWDYLIDPDTKIAYIRLTNFTKTTTDDLDAALQEVKRHGGRALILDLRYNPGGLLAAAIQVADRFLREGVIVETRADRATPNNPTRATARNNADEFELPVIVLVNQYSASASEIVSGALKDLRRAVVIGERSYGKGSVQMLFPLAAREAYLKLTTSHYYLPSGRCLHREEDSKEWGVDPDLAIEMTPEQMRNAIEARQEMDVLRTADERPAPDEPGKVKTLDPLQADAQLSAALLLLRLQILGGV